MQRVLLSLFLVIVLVMMVCSFLLFSSLFSAPQTVPGTTNSSLLKAAPSPTALPTPTTPPTPTALPTPTPTQLPTPLPSPTIAATPTIPPTPTPTPIVNSTAAFLLDDATGKVLFEKNSHLHLPIASTTKIMTAIVAIENANDLNQIVTIQQSELDEVPQGMSLAYLRAGDRIKLHDLLYGLLLPSGSDAAVVIAHTIGGTTPNFVAMMNAKAQVLQLADTHFSNPHGFSVPNHYSSAADLTSLARYAMQNPIFTQIVAQQSYTIPGTLTAHAYSWSNGNHLLATYQGMDGVKTGTSDDAGYCLVFSARRNGRHLLGAELNAAPNTLFPDVTRLLDMGFANAF